MYRRPPDKRILQELPVSHRGAVKKYHYPMPDRRALPATAGSMDCVDRSGDAITAPLHLSLPQHGVCTCSLVFRFQVSYMIAVQYSAVQKQRAKGESSLGFRFTFAYRIKQILR